MTIIKNDHTVGVLFPTTSGAQESKCLHNCFNCKKFIFTIVNKNVAMDCLERLGCSNGDKWEADDNTECTQEHQVKRPLPALDMADVGKNLLTDWEFTCVAKGSKEGGHWDEE